VLSLATAVVPLAVLAAVCWFDVRAVATTTLVAIAILAAVLVGWRARSDLREG
jgi:ABC-type transport system involved in cytochrome bd biosynthesis fused ATPase/permease subunit